MGSSPRALGALQPLNLGDWSRDCGRLPPPTWQRPYYLDRGSEVGGLALSDEEPAEGDFIDIEMLWADGVPLAGFAYVAKLADGSVRKGILDGNGRAHLAGVPPGEAEVTFPALQAAKAGN